MFSHSCLKAGEVQTRHHGHVFLPNTDTTWYLKCGNAAMTCGDPSVSYCFGTQLFIKSTDFVESTSFHYWDIPKQIQCFITPLVSASNHDQPWQMFFNLKPQQTLFPWAKPRSISSFQWFINDVLRTVGTTESQALPWPQQCHMYLLTHVNPVDPTTEWP